MIVLFYKEIVGFSTIAMKSGTEADLGTHTFPLKCGRCNTRTPDQRSWIPLNGFRKE